MGLKEYQRRLLDDYEAFLARTRELDNPARAFAESTLEAFGHSLPYHPLPGAESVPYVCLRVPTGGGKTRLAGQAIERVRRSFLSADFPLVIWLVPSDPIREQTLHGLTTPGELLYEDMRSLFGAVNVLNIDQALSVQPATLDTATTILVATMQSFKREGSEGLRVNRQNGSLMAHFTDTPEQVRGDQSLVDVIRLRHPFIVVDEAHSQGAPLAMDTLVKLGPSGVLELTATPDRNHHPSNVLRSVSAATLQGEDMLKLPLELAVHAEWRITLTEAIARLHALEKDAVAEAGQTGEVIHPIVMLIQAERRNANTATFTPDVVRKHLIEDFQVPAESIAIATGELDELAGKRLGDPDYPQFIITVDKLREGWDCPNAYVLFTFRNTTSATAVEQVLGRVLRMPNVKRKQHETLNRSYAYVVSTELAATVQGLRDGLVQSGFERLDTKQLIRLPDDVESTGSVFSQDLTVALPENGDAVALPEPEAVAALPAALRKRLEISPEIGTLTIRGGTNSQDIRKIAATFSLRAAATAIEQGLDAALAARVAPPPETKAPADRGEEASIPQLVLKQGSFFEVFNETALLDADWEIDSFDPELTEGEFAHDLEAMRRAKLSISELEKVECGIYDRLDSQLALFSVEDGWSATELVHWLDANIHFPYADRDQKVAWIGAVMTWLLEQRQPPFTIAELAYRKYRLRGAVERKLAAGLKIAKQSVFDALVSDESRFDASGDKALVIKQGRYAYDTPYTGLIPLKRHFFPVIGNLKDRGEEFDCAEFIANQLSDVAWWIRNVERKPTSFSLQTASDRFYPDFLIGLEGGGTIAVEYKGAHLSDSGESRGKKRIGELWERRSRNCAFAWVERRDWTAIKDAATRITKQPGQAGLANDTRLADQN
ncbi:DEAD/DEAH box helicase family protein [Lysobacter sp. F6437]|uniref:DEAD/DEAH box helicase family protein n=1 Tax=Lysobacter sp. F6437 TaxID=3459296 RepID=UPI00403DB2A1